MKNLKAVAILSHSMPIEKHSIPLSLPGISPSIHLSIVTVNFL